MVQRLALKYRPCISAVLFFSCIFYSCRSDNIKTVEGDLYFKLVDFAFFKAPESAMSKFEKEIWKVDKSGLNKQDKRYYTLIQYMSKYKLLRKPFIRIRSDDGEIKVLFLSNSDYKQFEQYKWGDLDLQNKKVRIKAEVVELKNDTLPRLELIKMLSVNKINGRTHMEK